MQNHNKRNELKKKHIFIQNRNRKLNKQLMKIEIN